MGKAFEPEGLGRSTLAIPSPNLRCPDVGGQEDLVRGGEYEVTGDLTIIGKTQSVTFPAKVSLEKSTLTGSGVITIERLKWGLQYGSGSIFKSLTADKIINDTFELKLSIVAKK